MRFFILPLVALFLFSANSDAQSYEATQYQVYKWIFETGYPTQFDESVEGYQNFPALLGIANLPGRCVLKNDPNSLINARLLVANPGDAPNRARVPGEPVKFAVLTSVNIRNGSTLMVDPALGASVGPKDQLDELDTMSERAMIWYQWNDLEREGGTFNTSSGDLRGFMATGNRYTFRTYAGLLHVQIEKANPDGEYDYAVCRFFGGNE